MPWQRPVKRNYEFDGFEEDKGRGPAEVLSTGCFKVLNEEFSELSEAWPDFGMNTGCFIPTLENPRDGKVPGGSCLSEKKFDHDMSLSNDGYKIWFNNTEQVAPSLLVNGDQSFEPGLDAKHVSNSERQRLHKKKGSQRYHGSCYMDRDDASRSLSSGMKRGTGDSLTSAPNFHRENDLRGSITKSEVVALREALNASRDALNALYIELEEERNASASAANEAMAVIARLQEEKATAQMEARQFKRMAEEREIHDQKAILFSEEVLIKKEDEILSLENELEAYRQILLRIESEGWGRETSHRIFLEKGVKNVGIPSLEGKKEAAELHVFKGCKSWKVDQTGMIKRESIVVGENPDVVDQRGSKHVGRLTLNSFRSNPVPIKSPFSTSGDRNIEGWNIMEPESVDIQKLNHDILQAEHMSHYTSGRANVPSDTCSLEPSVVCVQANSMKSYVDGSLSSVWEHVRRLEERFQQIGEQQCQNQRLEVDASSSVLRSNLVGAIAGGLERVSGTQFFCSDSTVRTSERYDAEEREEKIMDEKNSRSHSREFLQGLPFYTGLSISEKETSESALRASIHHCDSLGLESEDPGSQRGEYAQERVPAVYKVEHEHKGSGRVSSNFIDKGNGDSKERWNGIGKSDLLPESTIRGVEDCAGVDCSEPIMRVAGKYVPFDCEAGTDMDRYSLYAADRRPAEIMHKRVAMDRMDDHKGVAGEEVQHLISRLQALEDERVFMKQAIESLRKESEELKLLQEIAQKLRELKGSAKNLEQPKKSLQQEQPSILSFFKGILSFRGLQSTMQTQRSKHYCNFQSNTDFAAIYWNHVGLCQLLENSPYYVKPACVTRGFKVKLPTGKEGLRFFQGPLLPQPACDTLISQ